MDKTHFQVNLSVIILNKNIEVLLGKRSDNDDLYQGRWGIPGGKLEISDHTIEESLKREVREEVGVEITNIDVVSNNTRVHNGINKLFMVFKADYKSGEAKALDDTSEVKWVHYSQISRENMTPFTYDIIRSILRSSEQYTR